METYTETDIGTWTETGADVDTKTETDAERPWLVMRPPCSLTFFITIDNSSASVTLERLYMRVCVYMCVCVCVCVLCMCDCVCMCVCV